jgi:hypothetical protein
VVWCDGASANESWPDLIFGQGRPPPLSRAFIWATFIPKIGGLNAHLKRSGRAIEAHYQFLLWLVPSARA